MKRLSDFLAYPYLGQIAQIGGIVCDDFQRRVALMCFQIVEEADRLRLLGRKDPAAKLLKRQSAQHVP